MKIKCLLGVLLILAYAFLISSCVADFHGETEYYDVIDSRNVPYKDGMFMVVNNLLCFLDFDTMESLPVCYKPNCTHLNENECPAVKQSPFNTFFVYCDKLYSFESHYEYSQTEKPIVSTRLYVSDVSGANRREVARLDGYLINYGIYVKDGIAYFPATKVTFDDNGIESNYYIEHFYSFNLSNDGFSEIKCVTEGYNTHLSIIGCFDNKLVLEYREGTEKQEISGEKKYLFYCFESNEFEPFSKTVMRVQKEYLIYKESDELIVIQSIYHDEPLYISDHRIVNSEWGAYSVFDGKLILSGDGIAYDMETGEVYLTQLGTIIAYHNAEYIVRTIDGKYMSFPSTEFYLSDIEDE